MNKNNLNQNLFSIIILSFLFVFIGCGSFEGVSYYATDGIYNNDDSIKTQSENTESNNSINQSTTYYENYFRNFSNDSSNQTEDISNSSNEENNKIYIIDNSPSIAFRYGFNSFDYWNNWAFNDFWSPYNRFYSPYYNPYWNFGYQGLYFNNAWGYGYSLYGWNNYNPYNYIVSNQNSYGRKVPYNRGAVNQRSFNNNRLRGLSSNRIISPLNGKTTKNSRTNIGRKIRKVLGNFSPQNQSYSQINRGNSNSNRSNFNSKTYSRGSQSVNNSSSRSRSSVSSTRSKGGGRNNQ